MFNQKISEAKILVVDDQEANIAVLETLLERDGYSRVTGITDSRQVLVTFTEFAPDLILLDLLMPHLDGFAVLDQLRKVIPADTYVPILVLTADISPEARQRALSSGAKDFLNKPIDVIEVSLRIRNLLETRFLYLQSQNRSQVLNELVLERTTELTRTNEELTRANSQLRVEINERKSAEARIRYEAARAEALLQIASRLNKQLNLETALNTVCETAGQALKVPAATVYLYNASKDQYEYAANFGFAKNAKTLVATIPRSDYEKLITKADNSSVANLHLYPEAYAMLPIESYDICSLAWVNMMRGKQLIGNLTVFTFGQERAFTPDDLSLLQGISDQAAQAITNAHLYEEAQHRLQKMQALHRIDMAVSGSLELNILLKIILEELTHHLKVDAADILLMNPYMSTLDNAATYGFITPNIQKNQVQLGSDLAGRVALERTPIHISDNLEQEMSLQRFTLLAPEKFRAYFGIPLVAKGQIQGVIEIFHRAPLDPDAEWLEFIATIAGQTAIAVENINLFNKLQKSNTELALAYDITLEGWSRAMDLRDKETEGHTQRVADMTVRLAEILGLSSVEIANARRGALLHDMGKLGIPDSILHKPGQLTEEEWDIMKKHPTYAYEMLSPITYLRAALDIPYCHHEKWDGTGYPRGLKGESIPIAARIFSIADVWDALRSDRPYRKAWSPEKVISYIREHSGDYFDPKVVEAFFSVVDQFKDIAPKTEIRKWLIEE
ncbi:MAG: response regulator [Anaerolineales bacterium]|nr:response regulator [Anaerolineales bacterium]